jgi:hypothetical protein
MANRIAPSLVPFAVLCAAAASHAQVGPIIGEITHHWNLVEVHAGTNTPVPMPNGLVEPGEALRFELTVSFTPPVGTLVNWEPRPPAPGFGTVAGLRGVGINFVASGDATGIWSHFARPPGWLGSTNPMPNGWIQPLQVWQLLGGGITPNPANPVAQIWQGVWTPSSYEPRTIQWRREPTTSLHPYGDLAFEYGIDPSTGHALYTMFAAASPQYSLPVTIVPAPASALALAASAFLITRRRRP